MSTVFANNFEGGTAGTAITNGNSGGGSGTAFDLIVGTLFQFDATAPAHGSLCASVNQGGVAQGLVITTELAGLTTHWGRMYFKFTGLPSTSVHLANTQVTSSTNAWTMSMDATGHIKGFDATNTAITGLTFTNAMTANTWYRIEWKTVTDASAGTVSISLYLLDSATAIETKSVTAQNTGTAMGRCTLGPNTGSPTMPLCYFDDVAFSSSAALGPVTTPAPTQTSRPISDTNTNGLTGTPAVTPLAQDIGEATRDDTTYVSTGVAPVAQVNQFGMNNMTDPGPGLRTGFSMEYVLSAPSSTSSTCVVSLLQSTTVIASWTETSIPTTATDYVHILTDGQIATLTATGGVYLNLSLQTTWTAA